MSCADRSTGPHALIDLGDTLAECSPAIRSALARLRQAGEAAGDVELVPLPAYLEQRRREVMSTPGFWRGLAPRPEGFALLRLLQQTGFSVRVLTKGPYAAPQVWADKVAWCREYVPELAVIVTDDKASIHGHVLVDDWLPYVEAWQREWPAGLAIVPAQPWNVHASFGQRRIRDDPTNRAEITAALRGCFTG